MGFPSPWHPVERKGRRFCSSGLDHIIPGEGKQPLTPCSLYLFIGFPAFLLK
jgi:hypothetical protein